MEYCITKPEIYWQMSSQKSWDICSVTTGGHHKPQRDQCNECWEPSTIQLWLRKICYRIDRPASTLITHDNSDINLLQTLLQSHSSSQIPHWFSWSVNMMSITSLRDVWSPSICVSHGDQQIRCGLFKEIQQSFTVDMHQINHNI